MTRSSVRFRLPAPQSEHFGVRIFLFSDLFLCAVAEKYAKEKDHADRNGVRVGIQKVQRSRALRAEEQIGLEKFHIDPSGGGAKKTLAEF